MEGYIGVLAIILLMVLVVSRVIMLRRLGIRAMKFGQMDKRDFLIPPFALLYFYLILASAFDWPIIGSPLFSNRIISWIGVVFTILGLMLFLYSILSFGTSFRVGIDESDPGELITCKAFSLSRNPIYVAFGLVAFGIFLIFANWIFLLYLLFGGLLVHRQVLLEEQSLKKIYGQAYAVYCKKVRRYL